MKSEQDFDVIILGGGMVGASLACHLGQRQFKVALLDSHAVQFDWPAEGYDLRVSAITRATEQYLKQCHAWPGEQGERVSPFREMHVWDATGRGEIHFDSAELGEAYLGHIIENRIIVKALHQQLATLPTLSLYAPVQAQHFQVDAQQVKLTLTDGRELTARLLVGADGSRSWVRQQAGIAVRGWDYDQSALVTYVKTEHYHQDTAWQRFLSDGPLAFLPLTEGYSSIVWSTSPEHAARLKDMDEAQFALELAASFESRLGKIEALGPRAVFPLRFFETEAYVKPRIALVGDAAHTIHPLAGQGVNLGMADAQSLVQVLSEAAERKQDIGDYAVLRRYERWRRTDNRLMLISMDSFKRLFGSELGVLRWLRNRGLNLVDRLGPLKQMIMRQAMGSSQF